MDHLGEIMGAGFREVEQQMMTDQKGAASMVLVGKTGMDRQEKSKITLLRWLRLIRHLV